MDYRLRPLAREWHRSGDDLALVSLIRAANESDALDLLVDSGIDPKKIGDVVAGRPLGYSENARQKVIDVFRENGRDISSSEDPIPYYNTEKDYSGESWTFLTDFFSDGFQGIGIEFSQPDSLVIRLEISSDELRITYWERNFEYHDIYFDDYYFLDYNIDSLIKQVEDFFINR